VSGSATAPPSWKIKLLYDGGCPLCLREVRFLQQRDARRGLIAFVDVTDDDYRPEEHAGIDYAMAMGRIHAIKADGTILRNVEVFRQIYDLLGLGWIYAPTRWPLIGPLVDYLYTVWANWRLKLTGRPPLEVLLAQRQHRLQTGSEACCRLNEREGC
jgi:predicted DCC family thiol-disulfide oxidoreductase YuxK